MRSPLKCIWFSPRETTQYLIEQGTEKEALIAIVAATTLFSLFQLVFTLVNPWLVSLVTHAGVPQTPFPDFPYLTMFLVVFITAPIASWMFYRLFPISLHRFGLWLGGRATEKELRITISWGAIPLFAIMALALFLFQLPLAIFYTSYGESLVGQQLFIVGAFIAFFLMVLGVAIYANMVAVAERFSAWRAFGALCFSGILPATLVIFLLFFLGSLLSFIWGR